MGIFLPEAFDLGLGGISLVILLKAFFTGFHEVLKPRVIQGRGDILLTAVLGDGDLLLKSFQDNPDLLFGGEPLPGVALDVLDELSGRRFWFGLFSRLGGIHCLILSKAGFSSPLILPKPGSKSTN